MRVIGRVLENNAELFAASAAAVVLLLVITIVSRLRRRKGSKKSKKQEKMDMADMAAAPEIDDQFDDVTISIEADDLADDDLALAGELAGGGMDGDDMALSIEPDQLTDDLMPHFEDDGDVAVSEIDDIAIPRVGEAPPKKKSGFFASNWLSRGKSGADQPTAHFEMRPVDPDMEMGGMPPIEEDEETMRQAAECARLAEIERKMLALRELYEAGLIASEVYVIKAREFAEESKRG